MRLKWLWWLLGIPIGIALLGGAILLLVRSNHNAARAEWKDKALQELSALSPSNDIIRGELETRKRPSGPNDQPNWISDNVITTTNGEFLIFKSRHGHNDGFVKHLFLARASNEKWYFSTYHFCNGMVGIMAEDAPGSIAEFTNRYALREFDGKSDVCLEKTWPLEHKAP